MVKKISGILLTIAAILYPFIIFIGLVILKVPVRIFSLCVIVLALVFFLSITGRKKGTKKESSSMINWKPLVASCFFIAAGILCYFTNKFIFLKLYSVVVNVTLLIVFGSTLFFKPNICFRFATLQDKTIKGSLSEALVSNYCRKVTIIWCVFFIANGSAAVYTTFFCSDKIWSVYNGGISYVLMGILFISEYIVRRKVNSKMPKKVSITEFSAYSRKDNHIMCYDEKWSNRKYKTWLDFLTETAALRTIISANPEEHYILHCEDYWLFVVTFTALLQCQKEVILTANISTEFIKEIKVPGTLFFTDQDLEGSIKIGETIKNVLSQDIITEKEIRTTPKINKDETRIILSTSGSTGKPKAVKQRMTEFELDNDFIISKWGKEIISRKLITTVSQHHIYGFLFGISLPFTCGIPFRRKRIEFPEEFEPLNDASYMIIAVPAFLKRTVEAEKILQMKDVFIFTSGGVLLPEVAEASNKLFGFWPMEVYGSTETSGIAYRQSKNGLEWTVFDNAKIWKNEEGCLVIKSPYIKDKKGFATADLVDIHKDGRFILKGRSDSIVKIEEKRISMTEVENRILQTNLVKDVKVIAMSDHRQYLAAVIVFNETGEEKFKNTEKFYINKYFHDFLMQYFENVVIPKKWRYIDKIPCDIQGKKRKTEIKALFNQSDK